MDHAASTNSWLIALEQSGLGQTMRESPMLYPAIETLHIIGFSLLLGAIVAFDLRVLGLARSVPAAAVARITVPVAACGLALALPMGISLFSTEATHIAVNPAFQIKLVCIATGLANLVLFHLGPWRTIDQWGQPHGTAPLAARIGAGISALAWMGAVAGGRLIAYF